MENDNNTNPEQGLADNSKNDQNKINNDPNDINKDEAEFENPDVDPGFDIPSDNKLTSREDKRSGDIDSSKSVSEMRDEFEQKQNDAMNLGNDREKGSYNPKNI
jgi:hypothetical protein